ELMRWMPPPSGIEYTKTCVDAPCLASFIFDFSAGSSIGRVSGLKLWPSITPPAGMLFGKLGSHRFRELQALEPRG
ncbi:hypothetical protein, partial [uncultured Roseibium sp.]|uniref:hypothetical protein n=1 Tax=uncultured Roseibium sp. TaxID=1936171 RepID=UPI002624A77A